MNDPSQNPSQRREIIILVDHGSSYPEANKSVEKLAERLSVRLGVKVVATHMELAPPFFKDLIETLSIRPQLQRILVLPLFISWGKHLTEDIRGPLDQLSHSFPGMEVKLLPPLTDQETFADYLEELLRCEIEE